MTKEEAPQWPRWPQGTAGTVLLDVVVDLPVDELWRMTQGGDTEFRVGAGRVGRRGAGSCAPPAAAAPEDAHRRRPPRRACLALTPRSARPPLVARSAS